MNSNNEPYTGMPLWIELSGLPQLVLEKTKSPAGWAVLKKVIELDCALHPGQPGIVEISIKELAERAAVTPKQLRMVIIPLRNLHTLKCFLPDNDDDDALFELTIPLQVPIERDEIIRRIDEQTKQTPSKLRYWDTPSGTDDENNENQDKSSDKELQEVVDLYLNTIGTRINVFIVDELRLMRCKYPMPAIRRAFDRARKNEMRSLAWIASCLAKTKLQRAKKTQDFEESEEDRESNGEENF